MLLQALGTIGGPFLEADQTTFGEAQHLTEAKLRTQASSPPVSTQKTKRSSLAGKSADLAIDPLKRQLDTIQLVVAH